LVLQPREATLDVEVTNIFDLIEDLKQLRDRWDDILVESKLVGDGCGVYPSLNTSVRIFNQTCDKKRKRKRVLPDKTVLEDDFSHEDPYDRFKRCVYYPSWTL